MLQTPYDPTARFEALETRVAHQDLLLEELDSTVAAQWRRIDALVRTVERLTDQMRDLGRRDPNAPEPPPPHY